MSELLVIITVQKTLPGGLIGTTTWSGGVTPEPGSTRKSIFDYIRNDIITEKYPEFRDGAVLFYSAEPMELEAASDE